MKNVGDLAVKYIWPQKESGIANLITRMALNLAVNILVKRIRKRLASRLLPRRKALGVGRKGSKAAEELPRKAKSGKRRIIKSKKDGAGAGKKCGKAKKLFLMVPVLILAAAAVRLLKKKLA